MSNDHDHDHEQNRDGQDEIPGLRGLKLEQQPERDLWPAIEGRLQRQPRGLLRPRLVRGLSYAMAASLLGAVTLGLLRQAPSEPVPAAAPVEVAAVAAPAQRTVGHVNPQRQALLKANLSIVKDAEKQLKQALEQDPDSDALRRLLLAMQQQRGDLKTQLARDVHEQNT